MRRTTCWLAGLPAAVDTRKLASKLLVCGNGGNYLGCPVSFCRSGRYRFGVSFFRVPRIVLQWF